MTLEPEMAGLSKAMDELEVIAFAIKAERDSLKSALQDLLNAVESLEDYKLTRDLEPHKAQAVWDDAVSNAHSVIARIK